MADTSQSVITARGISWQQLLALFRSIPARGELAFGTGVIALVVMLILPLPPWLLDLMLSASITFSVLVLMTALMIRRPLDFSVFPAVLLLATLLRLALNIASTRLILSEGARGTDAAGAVIEAFGSFVMQGNYVIGAIIFVILVIVNFIVITKGSGRIAEVAARFTLDAMPGKQMAIDADLSAGLISEDQARLRRSELEGESNFFGAMDGASKFVRGDAIAGILITVINIIGGILIGVVQNDMSLPDASASYTILTIGDGLVSQIPALIISIAAGLLVSKAAVDGSAGNALRAQLVSNPQSLALVSFSALFAGLLPGMPLLPFAVLSALSGYGAWSVVAARKKAAKAAAGEKKQAEEEAKSEKGSFSSGITLDELRIELGFSLLGLINETEGRKLTEQIKSVRRQIAIEFGFAAPPVRIIDNMELDAEEYRILIREVEAGRGILRVSRYLAMNSAVDAEPLAGEKVKEPVFGLPSYWIDPDLVDAASMGGYTTVDTATVLTTHFTELVKEYMPDLLGFAATRSMVESLPAAQKSLIDDLVPSQISYSGIQRILQALLREGVSIRDLAAILEAMAEGLSQSGDHVALVEHVRSRLARQLCNASLDESGELPVITMSGRWERDFAEAMIEENGRRRLAMEPDRLHVFIGDVRMALDKAAQSGVTPVLLTSAAIRPYVRSLVERFSAKTVVMSQNEIHPRVRLKAAGNI